MVKASIIMYFVDVDNFHQIWRLCGWLLHHIDFHFQGQTFSCYAFTLKINCAVIVNVSVRFVSTRTALSVELLLFHLVLPLLLTTLHFAFS